MRSNFDASAPTPLAGRSVALAHDYLNQRGGAERVALALSDMWPAAPIFTSIYRPGSTFEGFAARDVRTSFLDLLPVDRGFRSLALLYPFAFSTLSPSPVDVLLASSSGWAHGISTDPSTAKIVYCHTPARWLYATNGPPQIRGRWSRTAASVMLKPLRRWDRRAAKCADGYIANAAYIRDRIRNVYGIEADVVHPPVDTQRFTPSGSGTRVLVVARLLPYKRVDLAIEGCRKAGLELDVVGDGPDLPRLRRLAGETVSFHGRVDDRELTELIETCKLLCQPGVEDFGIVPVEAHAAGKAVVAPRAGGALETVLDGVNGVFFDSADSDSVADALRRASELATSPEEVAATAERFSVATFRASLLTAVERILDRRGE